MDQYDYKKLIDIIRVNFINYGTQYYSSRPPKSVAHVILVLLIFSVHDYVIDSQHHL